MERVPCHLGVTTYEKSLGPLDALDRVRCLSALAVHLGRNLDGM